MIKQLSHCSFAYRLDFFFALSVNFLLTGNQQSRHTELVLFQFIFQFCYYMILIKPLHVCVCLRNESMRVRSTSIKLFNWILLEIIITLKVTLILSLLQMFNALFRFIR